MNKKREKIESKTITMSGIFLEFCEKIETKKKLAKIFLLAAFFLHFHICAYGSSNEVIHDTDTVKDEIKITFTMDDYEQKINKQIEDKQTQVSQATGGEKTVLKLQIEQLEQRIKAKDYHYAEFSGSLRENIEQLEKAQDVLPSTLFDGVVASLKAGEVETADNLLADFIQSESLEKNKAPKTVLAEAYYQRCRIAIDFNAKDGARDLCDKAVELDSSNWNYHQALGKIALAEENFAVGKKHLELAYAAQMQIYGENDLRVARTGIVLGYACMSLGQYDNALEMYEKALKLIRSENEEDPEIAVLLKLKGAVWKARGNYEKAIAFWEEALRLDIKSFGPDHPRVAAHQTNLGIAWSALAQYRKALDYYELALETELSVFGRFNTRVAITSNAIGTTLQTLGRHKEAIKYFEIALNTMLSIEGESSLASIVYRQNLGISKMYMKQYDAALKEYQQALTNIRGSSAQENLQVASVYLNMGVVLSKMNKLNDAISYYNQALEIHDTQKTDRDYESIALIINNIGVIRLKQKMYVEAKDNFEKALLSNVNVFGNDHPEPARNRLNLGLAYFFLGNRAKAKSLIETTLRCYEKYYGINHPETIKAKKALLYVQSEKN